MGMLKVLNKQGDMEIPFTETDHRQAKQQFAKLLKQGFWAYSKDGAHGGEVLRSFNPSAEEIVLLPQLRGG